MCWFLTKASDKQSVSTCLGTLVIFRGRGKTNKPQRWRYKFFGQHGWELASKSPNAQRSCDSLVGGVVGCQKVDHQEQGMLELVEIRPARHSDSLTNFGTFHPYRTWIQIQDTISLPDFE